MTTAKPISMNIYIYVYMHTRSSRMDSSYVRLENGKGTLMRCEELKACVQRTDGTRRRGTYIKVEGLFSRRGKDITVEAARIITTSLRWMEDGCVLNDISFFRCNLELWVRITRP